MKLSDFLNDVGRPVAYYPKLRRVSGSTTSTIFLCQFIYWIGREGRDDKYIEKSVSEIEDETGLSYKEQLTARKELVKRGLLEERYSRLDHKLIFRVNQDALNAAWEGEDSGTENLNELTISEEPENGHMTNGQMGILPTGRSYNSYTETTDTENTNKDSTLSLFAQPVDSLQAPATASASSGKREPKPKGDNVAPPGSSHAEMFAALADLCKVDPKLVNGQLGAQVKKLRSAGYTVADLERFGWWWYANDFRGKRGEPPTMGSVATDLPRSVAPPPLPVAPPDNQPHVDSLRSWHRTQHADEWKSHIAAERGTYPSDAKAYLEWYESEYGNLSEAALRQLWSDYKLMLKGE